MSIEETYQIYKLLRSEREAEKLKIKQEQQADKAKTAAYYANLKAKKKPVKTRVPHECSNCGETIPKGTTINHPQTILMPGSSQPDGNGHFETMYICNNCSPLEADK